MIYCGRENGKFLLLLLLGLCVCWGLVKGGGGGGEGGVMF